MSRMNIDVIQNSHGKACHLETIYLLLIFIRIDDLKFANSKKLGIQTRHCKYLLPVGHYFALATFLCESCVRN